VILVGHLLANGFVSNTRCANACLWPTNTGKFNRFVSQSSLELDVGAPIIVFYAQVNLFLSAKIRV